MRERQAGQAVTRAQQLLAGLRGTAPDDAELVRTAIELAGLVLEAAELEKRSDERARGELLARLMQDERGQAFTTLLTDRVYRSSDPGRVVDAARQLVRRLGVPDYLPWTGRL